jgi:hypothetical protein
VLWCVVVLPAPPPPPPPPASCYLQVPTGSGAKIALSPGGPPALSPLAMELAALGGGGGGGGGGDDEEALCCGVCREGYSSRPSELLGLYCYCRWGQGGQGGGAPHWGPHRGPPTPGRLPTLLLAAAGGPQLARPALPHAAADSGTRTLLLAGACPQTRRPAAGRPPLAAACCSAA